ncbi:MAG: hypothetical protein LH631_07795 [Alkalinema sp. CAN_BIN05]|nr:hypothetical protein [Alkalinema sp. CAN_BIN05]
MSAHPGAAVLAIFDELRHRVLGEQSKDLNGKPLNPVVFSHLPLGKMIDPRDYAKPWSPIGGSTLQDTFKSSTTSTPAVAASAAIDRAKRAINAAYNCSKLADRLIMVTTDGLYQAYDPERSIGNAYEGILNGMQAIASANIAPDVKKRVDEALKVLYQKDSDDATQYDFDAPTRRYEKYIENAKAYAKAKEKFARKQGEALSDPIQADLWPQTSVVYQQDVDDAWDAFKTQGAEKVERALATVKSVGVSLPEYMIAKARKTYDAWNLGLTGVVSTKTPYSYILPTSWCDMDVDDIGWQSLKISQSDYASEVSSSRNGSYYGNTHSQSSSTSGSGGFSLGFITLGGGGGGSSSSSSGNSGSNSSSQNQFKNTATNLTITIEYGLCDIHRDWLMSDLFYTKGWYLKDQKKNAVSDGTIDGQVGLTEALMPMLPTQFLVVRKVKIQSDNWGSDGQTMNQTYQNARNQSSSSSTNVSGGGGFAFGPLVVGGRASHSRREFDSSWSGESGEFSSGSSHWFWDGQTLEVKGAQIVAWVSAILPAGPKVDDPALVPAKTKVATPVR